MKSTFTDSAIKTVAVPADMVQKYKAVFAKKNVGSKGKVAIKEK